MMLAGLVIVVCALAALAYLVMWTRGSVDEARDKHEARILRDIPPPPSS